MLTIARKRQSNKEGLARGFVVATQAVIGKVTQLVVFEIQNSDRLAHTGLLHSISLIEQGGVTRVRAQCNGGGIAIGSRYKPGAGNVRCLPSGELNHARVLYYLCDTEPEKKRKRKQEYKDRSQ